MDTDEHRWNPKGAPRGLPGRCRGAFLLAAIAIVGAGCSGSPRGKIDRLAILPFENLAADSSIAWYSRGAPLVIAQQLVGSSSMVARSTPAENDARALRPTRILRGYYIVRDGRLRVSATLEDALTIRAIRDLVAEGPAAAGIVPLLAKLSRELDSRARPAPTANPVALARLVDANTGRDPVAVASACRAAITADPDCGACYLALTDLLVLTGDRAGAGQTIAAARDRGDKIPEYERAVLDTLDATLRKDNAALAKALAAAARLAPADLRWPDRLVAAASQQHDPATALEWARKGIAADPSDPARTNNLGYLHAYAGDLEGAKRSLLEYQKLAPNAANPPDSLGEVSFYFGRFQDAERYFLESAAKDATILGGAAYFKAAQSRLMTGDIPGADELFKKYLEVRRAANDSIAGHRQAQFDYACGRRKQAMAQLAAMGGRNDIGPSERTFANLQLAFWLAEAGRRDLARQTLEQAAKSFQHSDVSPLIRQLVVVAAEPASANEIASRCSGLFPESSQTLQRRQAEVYGLLFAGHYTEAARAIEQLYKEMAPPADGFTRQLLAWALIESGRIDEAGKLLQVWYIPQSGLEYTFASLAFPRSFYLRGVVLEKQGKRDEARANYALFVKLSGDTPDAFGTLEKAQAALKRL